MIVGSNTAKVGGTQFFCEKIPPEDKEDFKKPDIHPDDTRAYWMIADSRGTLEAYARIQAFRI